MSLRLEEMRKLPNLELMECQIEITWEMRHQLLEFLAEAQSTLGLSSDSWALSVSILDRYMSQRYVYAKLFQLLGSVCLWIAAKSCDDKRRVPTTTTLAFLCGNIYPEAMFNEMELHVLASLEWNVIAPTAFDFIDLSTAGVERELKSRAAHFQSEDYKTIRSMACYVSECALYSSMTLAFRPSEVAASAVSLSTLVLDDTNRYNWPMVNTEHSSKECFDALVAVITNPPVRSVQRYTSTEHYSVPIRFDMFVSKMSCILDDNHPRTPYSDTSSWDEDSSISSPDSFSAPFSQKSSPRTPVELGNSRGPHLTKMTNAAAHQCLFDDVFGQDVGEY